MTRTLAVCAFVGYLLAAALAAAAPPGVTITAYPTVSPDVGAISLSGAIDQPRAGELVTVEGKECGVPGSVFRGLAAAQTVEGGAWSTEYRPRTKTVLRAVWGKHVSPEVTVLRHALLTFAPRPGGRFRITLWGLGLSSRRVRLERFDTKPRAWRIVRTVTLRSDSGYTEAAEATVRLPLPGGTTLRAVLPLAQAKPCYLAGYSKLIRT